MLSSLPRNRTQSDPSEPLLWIFDARRQNHTRSVLENVSPHSLDLIGERSAFTAEDFFVLHPFDIASRNFVQLFPCVFAKMHHHFTRSLFLIMTRSWSVWSQTHRLLRTQCPTSPPFYGSEPVPFDFVGLLGVNGVGANENGSLFVARSFTRALTRVHSSSPKVSSLTLYVLSSRREELSVLLKGL